MEQTKQLIKLKHLSQLIQLYSLTGREDEFYSTLNDMISLISKLEVEEQEV